ncbi:MAG: energy transducer TonB [Burkholderiaceae bacterium]|jgi:protein TonB|nr:energy transducer TonB [Burkholderiaceae bacterium]
MEMPWNRSGLRWPLAAAALLAGATVFAGSHETLAELTVAPTQAQTVLPAVSQGTPPVYPAEARQAGLQGRVLVRALVDSQGRVMQTELRQSSGHAVLDQAAMDTVRGWRFTPGTRHGVAESMWAMVPIRFSLDGKVAPAVQRTRAPFYPPEARQLGQQGRVVVRVLVDEQGKVAEAVVKESSGHPLLDQAALAAARGWSFTPGRRHGMPEAMWARVPIHFTLDPKAGR